MQCFKPDCDMSGPEWAFRKLTRAHHIASGAVFDRCGLKDVGQPVMLFILSDMRRAGCECSQRELCDMLNLSQSLERRGYIRRRSDSRDMRKNIVEITDAGAETAENCRRAFDSVDRAMYAGFSEADRQLITQLFDRITANLTALAKQEENK